jgi:quercetin dioxygenase-like cupin family protein
MDERNFSRTGLKRLKGLTESLPTFCEVVKIDKCPVCIEMKTEDGVGFGWNIVDLPNVSVAKWYSSEGAVYPRHAIDKREWLIVYEGTMIVEINGDTKTLNAGQYVCVEPDTPHQRRFPQDCWYLEISVPPSEEWGKHER